MLKEVDIGIDCYLHVAVPLRSHVLIDLASKSSGHLGVSAWCFPLCQCLETVHYKGQTPRLTYCTLSSGAEHASQSMCHLLSTVGILLHILIEFLVLPFCGRIDAVCESRRLSREDVRHKEVVAFYRKFAAGCDAKTITVAVHLQGS